MIFARVGSRDVLNRYLDIFICQGESPGNPTHVLGDDRVWQPVDDGVVIQPTVQIDELAGRSLLQELLRYYDGGEDTRSLRRDYDAERKRVDLLVNALVGVATPMLTVRHQ